MPDLTVDQALELAFSHYNSGQFANAESLTRQILAQFPRHPDALHLLGILAVHGNRHDAAIDLFHQAIAAQPGKAFYFYSLGNVYEMTRQYDQAIDAYHQALRIDPHFADAQGNLAVALQGRGNIREALQAFLRALQLNPRSAMFYTNLGLCHHDQGNLAQAMEAYENALRCDPEYAAAHFNIACAQLLTGNFQRGWVEYEWRWKFKHHVSPARNFPQPLWTGQDLHDKTILLHDEQGFGDAIQFSRYIPLVAERHPKRIIVECHASLISLFQSVAGTAELVERFAPLPPFDFQIPLLSLPLAFHTTLDTIPHKVPYLSARPDLVTHFHNLLTQHSSSTDFRFPMPDTPLRVGLAWAGSPIAHDDKTRSIPFDFLAPLFQLPGVSFVSLQNTAIIPPSFSLVMMDLSHSLTDFSHTAALIANLDLVISVDTAAAHLAGAMGKKVWTLLPFMGEWRWMLNRPDSPWYPTMKLFRQPTPGNWPAVIEQVAQELRSFFNASAQLPTPNENDPQ